MGRSVADFAEPAVSVKFNLALAGKRGNGGKGLGILPPSNASSPAVCRLRANSNSVLDRVPDSLALSKKQLRFLGFDQSVEQSAPGVDAGLGGHRQAGGAGRL